MEKKILDAIKSENNFDGTYYEKFLTDYVDLGNGDCIVRVIDVDGEVVAHTLDTNDETDFVPFKSLDKDVQIKVYADIFSCKIYDFDEFFEHIKDFLDVGDKLVVGANEEGGVEYKIYYVYNSCGFLIGEYNQLTHLYTRY